VIEHKRLTPITAEEVRKAFGTNNVEVFTESEALQAQLKSLSYENTALLMMSSRQTLSSHPCGRPHFLGMTPPLL
jgi:UDP-N-acetylmuramate: L-alanyl-gamma-D-glutamyl-meso-diaminopimelate ligase